MGVHPGPDSFSPASFNSGDTETLGVYISVPFCKAKCSYCNFASGVFAAGRMQSYVDRVCAEMQGARGYADKMRTRLPTKVDSVYLGGGTPSLLEPAQLRRIFERLQGSFEVSRDAEITLECAPGQISDAVLAEFVALGVNRVSFGVQSFVDQESRAVGRLHTGIQCLAEISRVRAAGIAEINVDLIAGLPHQTAESFRVSLDQAIGSGVPHVSVYMLEVDEDSRLGSELLAGGVRYHAHHVPDEDLTADLYVSACEMLAAAGIEQYEISNFARSGHASRHNLKYWRRSPYLGFGMDAHSMLTATGNECDSVRFSNVDDLNAYLDAYIGGHMDAYMVAHMAGAQSSDEHRVSAHEALEESLFLGLRMNAGVRLDLLRQRFGAHAVDAYSLPIRELVENGLLESDDAGVRLTARGRLVSNEVFGRLLEVVAA